MSVTLPAAFPESKTGERASIFVPPLGKTVVKLSPEEVTKYSEQIEAMNLPMFYELKGPEGVASLWALEEDLAWLLKQNESPSSKPSSQN